VIDGVYFWRLHVGSLPGLPNTEQVQIVGVHKGGVPMQLEVRDGDYLLGRSMTGAVYAQGTTLPGTRIQVTVKDQPYELRITGAAPSEKLWVGAQQSIWTYQFSYRRLFGPDQRTEHPLCSEGDGDPGKLSALVFAGDLYDPATKEIEVGPATDGWINIACADSAIYKMHKIGHTSAAQGKGGIPATSVAQRRAMLNAWTSKVCGTGEAFTQPGEPIRLRESLGMLPVTSPYHLGPVAPLDLKETESIEAIWGEAGAICLNVHRLEGSKDELPIPCRDALPSCDELLGDWTSHGHVVTGNPPPGP
jgi:hypothetical protein